MPLTLADLAVALSAEGYTTKTWANELLYVRHPQVPDRELGYLTIAADGSVVLSRFSRRGGRTWRNEIARIVKAAGEAQPIVGAAAVSAPKCPEQAEAKAAGEVQS